MVTGRFVFCRRALGLVVCSFAAASAAADNVLSTRDQLYRHGEIAYQFKSPGRAHAKSRPNPPQSQEVVLWFADDGRYLQRFEKGSSLPSGDSSLLLVKGKDYAYSEEETGKGTKVSFEDESWFFRNTRPEQFLTERPCGPLGLGLSGEKLLSDSVTAGGGREIRTEKHRLVLDRNGAPKVLQELASYGVFSEWTYTGGLKQPNGLVLPKVATYWVPRFGLVNDETYTIKRANLSKTPTDRELTTDWFRPGVVIWDNRVNPGVRWSYDELLKANGGRRTLTPQHLLVLSKGMWSFFNEEDAKKKKRIQAMNADSGRRETLWLYLALPVLAFATYLSLRFARGRRS